MKNLNDMLIFAKVAELQGISPAARALRIPKSKVSRRMAALEHELGTRLLERSTRAVHLTEVGEIYWQHCNRVVEEVQCAQESISRMLEIPRGHLRISTSVSIGQHLLAPHLGKFIAQYPEIEVEFSLNNRRVDVIAEGYDLAVRVGQLQDSTLVSRRLFTGHASLFASPGYINQFGSPEHPDDLRQHRMLVMGDSIRAGQWTLVGPSRQLETIPTQPAAIVNDFVTIRQAAIDGAGIALLPNYINHSETDQQHLQPLLADWHSPPFSVYALYPSARGMTLKVRAWLDFFIEKLGNSVTDQV